MDADIQYLDFFAYFKDVLSGKNNIAYTLGKTLGGTNIAVFSYYLSSPFSLLLVFFSKDRLETFFDFVVTLKLMTCALTFCNFTVHRFRKSISSLWKKNNCCGFISELCTLPILYCSEQQYYVVRWRLSAPIIPTASLSRCEWKESRMETGWDCGYFHILQLVHCGY